MGNRRDELDEARYHPVLRAVQERGEALDSSLGLPSRVGNADRLFRPLVEKTPRPRKVYIWTCQYCGQPFETTHYGQRYCNRTHREYAYRERVKQR